MRVYVYSYVWLCYMIGKMLVKRKSTCSPCTTIIDLETEKAEMRVYVCFAES